MTAPSCQESGCGTLLSRYNKGSRCALHDGEGRLQRYRGVELPRRLVEAGSPPGWADRAACRGLDVGMFFVGASSWRDRAASARTLAAKALCVRCPVRRECLEFAIRQEPPGYPYGVFGGVTGRERYRVRHVPMPGRVDLLLARADEQARDWGLVRGSIKYLHGSSLRGA